MPKPLSLVLTAEQRRELEHARAHHPKPYMREKAAALLKVADGASARQVAAHGLLVRRRYETISRWVTRFRSLGLAGLSVGKGRGRKPAFFPSARDT
jgi:transposase